MGTKKREAKDFSKAERKRIMRGLSEYWHDANESVGAYLRIAAAILGVDTDTIRLVIREEGE